LTPVIRRTLELGYPPCSPWFWVMRRLTLPPPTLLLRRMELQTLSVLGELRAGGDWAALAAEHWSDQPPSTPLGREQTAFFEAVRQRGSTRQLTGIDQKGAVSSWRSRRRTLVC
jgi:hypothetical protein